MTNHSNQINCHTRTFSTYDDNLPFMPFWSLLPFQDPPEYTPILTKWQGRQGNIVKCQACHYFVAVSQSVYTYMVEVLTKYRRKLNKVERKKQREEASEIVCYVLEMKWSKILTCTILGCIHKPSCCLSFGQSHFELPGKKWSMCPSE